MSICVKFEEQSRQFVVEKNGERLTSVPVSFYEQHARSGVNITPEEVREAFTQVFEPTAGSKYLKPMEKVERVHASHALLGVYEVPSVHA